MPYKNPEKKKEYQRDYMRQRRAEVRPSPQEPVRPHQEQAEPPRFFDRSKPYTIEDRYPYPAYLVQDGFWFDPGTRELVGKASREWCQGK
jgi:hypothetical protein